MTDALSPFSASGQIIAVGNYRRANYCHAMVLGRAIRSKGVWTAAVIFQLQFAQDLLKSRRSEIAAVLTPM
jgi:hypothetical protein